MKTQHTSRSEFATRSQIGPSKAIVIRSLVERATARGIRLTKRRKVLLDILDGSDGHLDAAALLEIAKERMSIDRATVYRTLDLLKKEGLVDELDLMHLRGEMHYYEARTGREHFHLACFRCGRIEEVTTPLFDKLKQQVAQDSGFVVATARLEIGGYCSVCVSSDASHAPETSRADMLATKL